MEPFTGRLALVVWVVRPENLDHYVKKASEMFNVNFEYMHGPDISGAPRTNAVSWHAGLEFVAPLDDSDAISRRLLKHLDERGEGQWGIVFQVPDVEVRAAELRASGHPVGDFVQRPDKAARRMLASRWTTNMTDCFEVSIGQFLGSEVLIGEIELSSNFEAAGETSGPHGGKKCTS